MGILNQLPPVNKHVLRRILVLLQSVLQNAENNKMTAVNLSITFAPNILRSQKSKETTELLTEAQTINSITKILVSSAEEVVKLLEANTNQVTNNINQVTNNTNQVTNNTNQVINNTNQVTNNTNQVSNNNNENTSNSQKSQQTTALTTSTTNL